MIKILVSNDWYVSRFVTQDRAMSNVFTSHGFASRIVKVRIALNTPYCTVQFNGEANSYATTSKAFVKGCPLCRPFKR